MLTRRAPRRPPGEVRDSIIDVLRAEPAGATVAEIRQRVAEKISGELAESSVRSFLRLNTPSRFIKLDRGVYKLNEAVAPAAAAELAPLHAESPIFTYGSARLYQADCVHWLKTQPENSAHAVVTDPPYGLVEYSETELAKLRKRRGGVWRIPPAFDGHARSPVPRFTVLRADEIASLCRFFHAWAKELLRVIVPGGNVLVASNPLLSFRVAGAIADAGFERRGEVIRLVMTLRGGDRPKNAHEDFPEVSVMARSMWEPWLLFRKPFPGRVQDNLRRWKTGGLRRPSKERPFGDVIESHPTRTSEKVLAPHPSLKPQSFLRRVVRGILPLGEGIVLDPFAGSGSTLAAAEAVGYSSVGVEMSDEYIQLAKQAIPKLHRWRDSRDEAHRGGRYCGGIFGKR